MSKTGTIFDEIILLFLNRLHQLLVTKTIEDCLSELS